MDQLSTPRDLALEMQARIDQQRSALYAREAKGEIVPEDEWILLGTYQQQVNTVLHPTNAQGYYI